MNKNIKIAKQLIKLAKNLVAVDYQSVLYRIQQAIKKNDTKALYNAIVTDNKLSELDISQAIKCLIDNNDTEHLFSLLFYQNNKLDDKNKQKAMNCLINNNDTEHLYIFILNDKLDAENKQKAIDCLIDNNDTKHLYELILNDKLDSENQHKAINCLINKNDTKHLYELISQKKITKIPVIKSIVQFFINTNQDDILNNLIKENALSKTIFQQVIENIDKFDYNENITNNTSKKLNNKQMSSYIDSLIKENKIQELSELILKNKLTEELKDKAIKYLLSNNDTEHLYKLILNDKLNENDRIQAIQSMIYNNDIKYLCSLISNKKFTNIEILDMFKNWDQFLTLFQTTNDKKHLYHLINSSDVLTEEQINKALELLKTPDMHDYLYRLLNNKNNLSETQKNNIFNYLKDNLGKDDLNILITTLKNTDWITDIIKKLIEKNYLETLDNIANIYNYANNPQKNLIFNYLINDINDDKKKAIKQLQENGLLNQKQITSINPVMQNDFDTIYQKLINVKKDEEKIVVQNLFNAFIIKSNFKRQYLYNFLNESKQNKNKTLASCRKTIIKTLIDKNEIESLKNYWQDDCLNSSQKKIILEYFSSIIKNSNNQLEKNNIKTFLRNSLHKIKGKFYDDIVEVLKY